MTIINISGYSVMLDDEDVERIARLKWHVGKTKAEKYGLCYFRHTVHYHKCDKKQGCYAILLHRYIMGCAPEAIETVDHIDGNTLNCQKSNLRICSGLENSRNRKRNKNNLSGYKGVSRRKASKKWVAQIQVEGRNFYLGSFTDPKVAHEAYKEAAIKYHGEFARFE
jgi:hypothetical protein